jgi:hypothetical protein
MAKKEDFIGFYNSRTHKLLGAISVRGLSAGELRPTGELLAYNNHIKPSSIRMKVVRR